MLDGNAALNDLLDRARNDVSVQPFIAEFFTIWDWSGAVIARWTDADRDLFWNGNWYVANGALSGLERGPGIQASQITSQIGTSPSELDIGLFLDDAVTLNGKSLAAFIAGGGLFQATIQHEEAYAETILSPIVGTLPLFRGFVTQMRNSGATNPTLVVTDVRNLLNVQVPPNLFQPPCLHTVYDSGCTLNRDNFKVLGMVQGGDVLTLLTNVSAPPGYLDLGDITFTSGPNKGVMRSIKVQNADGSISVVPALPNAPQPGDTFVSHPGCDLLRTTCSGKFNNLAHFKGYLYIPTIETAAP